MVKKVYCNIRSIIALSDAGSFQELIPKDFAEQHYCGKVGFGTKFSFSERK